jgi:hypothetical protein
MCSIQAGLTSAISLPLPLVMIAFAFFVLPSLTSLHHVSAQSCRQRCFRDCCSSTMLSLDKEVSHETIAVYIRSLSWETCLVFPLSGKPNNPALSSKALLSTTQRIYIDHHHGSQTFSLQQQQLTSPSPTVQLIPKPKFTEKESSGS